MKIGKFKVSNRAVSPVIATLLMIAIAVAASIIVYVWSIGLLGGLMTGGGSQTTEQLILESFNGNTTIVVRNVGTRPVTIAATYVDGAAKTNTWTASASIAVGGTASNANMGITADGRSHTVKLVSSDGAVFVFTVIGGQAG